MKLLQPSHMTKSANASNSLPSLNYANFSSISNQYNSSSTWIIDTDAGDHMCHEITLLIGIQILSKPFFVGLPNGHVLVVIKIRTIKLIPDLSLSKVLYEPQFKHNLLSVSLYAKIHMV